MQCDKILGDEDRSREEEKWRKKGRKDQVGRERTIDRKKQYYKKVRRESASKTKEERGREEGKREKKRNKKVSQKNAREKLTEHTIKEKGGNWEGR